MPESLRDSKLYGVELDSISGRIAKQLYPDADIRITGYETSGYPDDFLMLRLEMFRLVIIRCMTGDMNNIIF